MSRLLNAADTTEGSIHLLSTSWPGAVAPVSKMKPEPPRAPKKGPATAMWVVPPLWLPAAPRKGSLLGEACSTAVGDCEFSLESDAESDSGADEAGVFILDGECGEATEKCIDDGDDVNEDGIFNAPKMSHILGLNAHNDHQHDDGSQNDGNNESTSCSSGCTARVAVREQDLPFGTSPLLRSVLEQLAMGNLSYMQRQTTV